MILYICEKPAQAQDIARNLRVTKRCDGYMEGNDMIVTWCIGHLLELAPPEHYKADIKPWHIDKLPIIPQKWEMLVSKKMQKQFNVIKRLLKQTCQVVIASDPDREGETIVREILAKCQYQGRIERLWLSALDDKSIQKALNTIRAGHETENLYYAGIARARADYLIGMNMTMAASSLYGVNSVLSIGRVQTPTLKLVVDRDEAIKHFVTQDYFVLKILFSDNQNSFWAAWQAPEQALNEHGHCVNQAMIENIAAKVDDEPGVVRACTEKQQRQKAPLCFSLSSLQKRASSLYGYSAKQVLTLAQSLYETHKATTYPRTDCGYLPEEQFNEASAVLAAVAQADSGMQSLIAQCDTEFKSSVWNSAKVTAHHGIIPTLNDQVDMGKMTAEELNLYDLIRRQYIAQFLGHYKYMQRFIEMNCAGETFTATGNTPIEFGWKQAFKAGGLDEDESKDTAKIPQVTQGQSLENMDTQLDKKQTKPPAHFNEGTLIEAMKTVGKFVDDEKLKKILKVSSGIGTEATRANILETLFKRGYLERKSKQVLSTTKGRALIALAPSSVKNPVLTAQWEQKLEAISQGNGDYNHFVESQADLLHKMLMELQNEGVKHVSASLQLK